METYNKEKVLKMIDDIATSKGSVFQKIQALAKIRREYDTDAEIVDKCGKYLTKLYELRWGAKRDIVNKGELLDNYKRLDLDEALGLKETYERNIEKDLQTYCDLLMKDLESNYPNSDTTFTFTKGGRYYKILQVQSYGQSVHAFVDEDGNVYKPAGWRAPAKGVRARLEDIVDGKRKVDFAGGYLYKDRYVQETLKEKNEDLEYDYDDAKSWEDTFDVADEQETTDAFQQPVKGKNKTYSPKLSVEEVRELALEHYNEGGDVVIEAWTDEDIIMWIEEHGTKEELLDLFSKYYDQYQDMIGYGDYAIWDEEDSEDSTDDEQELNQDYYDEEDFGPNNPWDAPGMSIKDFLR